MAREMINDMDVEQVVGGSIVFNADCTMCGLNCTNQCKVNDFDAVIQFIRENKDTMKEGAMLKQMVSLGYISRV